MLEINATSKFKKDRKQCIKRGYDMGLLNKVVNTLCIPALLPPANKDHGLVGNHAGRREYLCSYLSTSHAHKLAQAEVLS